MPQGKGPTLTLTKYALSIGSSLTLGSDNQGKYVRKSEYKLNSRTKLTETHKMYGNMEIASFMKLLKVLRIT